MNINLVSQAAKMDVISSVAFLLCVVTVLFAIELSAPVIAGVGALGAAASGVVRLVVSYKKS